MIVVVLAATDRLLPNVFGFICNVPPLNVTVSRAQRTAGDGVHNRWNWHPT